MPNIFHQSVEDILKAATPEQRLLWNHLFLRYGERIAVSQFCYFGTYAGAGELLAFSANKIYLCYQFTAHEIQGVPLAGNPVVSFFDETNNAFRNYSPTLFGWDVTAAAWRYYAQSFIDKNFYFARLSASQFDYLNFIGYRIGI